MERTRPEEEEEELAQPEHITGSVAATDPQQYPPSLPLVTSVTSISGGSQDPYPPSAVTDTPVSFVPMNPQPFVARPSVGDSSPLPVFIDEPWSTGLFDCNLNQSNAIMTAFFPCVTFGQIAEILDERGTSCLLGCFMYMLMVPALLTCCIIGSKYRKKLRSRYNLVQAPSHDWTVHLFCPFCALCQEYRELQDNCIDPSLGWMGYLTQQQEAMTLPPENQFMSTYYPGAFTGLDRPSLMPILCALPGVQGTTRQLH